jgi:hypothetical protein
MKGPSKHIGVLLRLLLLTGLVFVMATLFACAWAPTDIPSAEQAALGAAPAAVDTVDAGSLTVRSVPGSWSYVNGGLSLVGFMEALLALMGLFYRSKRPPSLFSRSFVLRAAAQAIAFVVLVATCISADFSGTAVAFDKMSAFVVVLFVFQQAALYGARQKRGKRAMSANDGPKEHFRAQTRFED